MKRVDSAWAKRGLLRSVRMRIAMQMVRANKPGIEFRAYFSAGRYDEDGNATAESGTMAEAHRLAVAWKRAARDPHEGAA